MRKLLFLVFVSLFLLVFGCGGDMSELPPCVTCSEGNGRCGGREFSLATQRCQSGVIETECGSGWYDASNSNFRCQSNVVETNCGSGWYDATNFRCQNGVLETKCGSGWYDASNSNFRCQNNVVETNCGSGWYDVSTQRCGESNIIETKCGSDWYDASSMQLCSGGTLRRYKTVEIGYQIWMAENLNYNVSGSRCFHNAEYNCNASGRLYDWYTAMALPSSCNSSFCSSQIDAKHQGICPSGWHIPTRVEWNALTSYVESDKGCNNCADKHLKAISGWDNCGTSGSGSSYLCEDSYGFSALPGGYGKSDGYFSSAGYDGYWWSSSELDANIAHNRGMGYNYEFANWGGLSSKINLFSVRCLQD